MIWIICTLERWRAHDDDTKAPFLGGHMIPVLLGPKKRHYVIDHHHLSLALHEGVESVLVTVVADLHKLDTTTPFSEFLWADLLRRRLKRKDVERDFDGALKEAGTLAKSMDAGYLPGWCGPVEA